MASKPKEQPLAAGFWLDGVRHPLHDTPEGWGVEVTHTGVCLPETDVRHRLSLNVPLARDGPTSVREADYVHMVDLGPLPRDR